MTPACTGECCRRFPLSCKLATLVEIVQAYPLDAENAKILDMVILIDRTPEYDYFTCKNWDPETKLCRTYETRPRMCREYPYARACEFCGWNNAEPPGEKKCETVLSDSTPGC